jgi:hypothetical protein
MRGRSGGKAGSRGSMVGVGSLIPGWLRQVDEHGHGHGHGRVAAAVVRVLSPWRGA